MYQIFLFFLHIPTTSYNIPTPFLPFRPLSHFQLQVIAAEKNEKCGLLRSHCKTIAGLWIARMGYVATMYIDHWLISPCAQDNFLRLWPIKFAFISTLYSGSCHNYTMPKLYNPFRGTCLEGVAQKCCYALKKTGLYWNFNLDHADVRLVSSLICRRGSVGPR